MLIDEDSGDEDESGLVVNLSGIQLAANAEAVFHDGHRTTENDCEVQLNGDDKATLLDEYHSTENDNETCNVLPIMSYRTVKWSIGASLTPGDCLFPKANYVKHRDFTPVQLRTIF